MINVFVLGQPFWGSCIARALTSFAIDMRGIFVGPGSYARLLARPPRSGPVFIMRVGYRVGATTARGRMFDAYWSLLRRSLPDAVPSHYWLGTDVLDTIEEAQAGTLRQEVVSSARGDLHLADAAWLAAELELVGIEAVTAHVPAPLRAPAVPPSLPEEFSVLTYLAANRFDFYGGETVLEAARRLPDVRVDVVGSAGQPGRRSPPNVRWHGWVADMPRYYAGTTTVVRIPHHDGLGQTVVEGLLNARHVVYTHEVPFVRKIWPATPEALVGALAALRDEHAAGRLGANLAGRAHALEEFNEARLAGNLAALLRGRV
jgi:hypothetical protein